MATQISAPKQHRNAGKKWGTPFEPGKSGNASGLSQSEAVVRQVRAQLMPGVLVAMSDLATNPNTPPRVAVAAGQMVVNPRALKRLLTLAQAGDVAAAFDEVTQ